MSDQFSSVACRGSTERTMFCPPRHRSQPTSRNNTRNWVQTLEDLRRKRAEHPDQAALAIIVHQPNGAPRLRTRLRFGASSQSQPIALALGRHTHCDMPGLRDASLRHALVLAWPNARHPVEVVDLRSNTGLIVSSGKSVERLRGAGPMRFMAGSDEVTVLYAAPGAPLEVDLPHELDGWIEIEERRMLGDLSDEAPSPPKTNPSYVMRDGATLVRVADKRILDSASHEIIPASVRRLREGLLLGRYERCDKHLMFTTDEMVSRVHAFIVERDGSLHVIDAGSTHGTFIIDARDGRELRLLNENTRAHTLSRREQILIASKRVAIELGANKASRIH